VSNIEIIKLKNVNTPSAAATGSAESATIVFKALAAGQTLTIAGITFTAGTSGATAAQVAAAFANPATAEAETTDTDIATANELLVVGGKLTGATIDAAASVTVAGTAIDLVMSTAGYNPVAGTAVVDSAVFGSTATTFANVTDLVATGTAVTGRSQVVTMAIATEASAAMAINVNGVSVAVPNGANLKADATSLADSINSYLGYTAAVVTPTSANATATGNAHTVTVTTPTNVNFGVAAGTDLVVVNTLGTAFAAAAAPTITITQGVAPTAAGSGEDTVAAGNFVGATSFVNTASTGNVKYTGLASTQSLTIEGNNAVTNGATDATWSTATTPTINVINGTKAGNLTVTASAASNITLTSSGAPLTTTGLPGANTVGTVNLGGLSTSTLTIKADSNIALSTDATFTTAAKDIIVSGAATTVNLGAGTTGTTAITAANLATIDASGMTAGGVAVALTTGTKAFVGGQGNDTVATAAFTNTGVTVNAGAGTGDTLIISSAGELDSTTEAAVYTNFETIRAAAGSFDASLMPTATSIQMTGAGTLSNMTATQAANVQIRTSGAYVTSLKDSTGSADVLSIKLGTGTTTDPATSISTGLTANGFETINLGTNAGSTSTVGANKISTIAAFTADKATAINLTGNSFILSNIATTKAVTIDGSALTGDGQATPVGFTVAGDAVVGSTVIGSAHVDTFTLGAVGSTYNAGAGDDAISGSLGQYRTSTTYNTVDAGAGIDTATISGGAALTMVDDDFKGLINVEKITVATTTTNNQSITTGGWFDANFKAAGATITTTSTDGNITIAAGSFTGNLTLVVTTADTAGANAGIVTITTGTGNDKVTVSDTGSAAGTIATGAGNDTIVGGGVVETITGGTGADTITGGAGADVFVFAAGASGLPTDTNFDTITDYATNSDIISLGAYTIVTYTSTTAGTATIGAAGIATFQTADVTLAQRIIATENAINAGGTATAGQTAAFQFLNDAYVFVSDGVDGVGANDRFIKLVGIDTTAAATDTITAATAGETFVLA
jgi:hypothetical protein